MKFPFILEIFQASVHTITYDRIFKKQFRRTFVFHTIRYLIKSVNPVPYGHAGELVVSVILRLGLEIFYEQKYVYIVEFSPNLCHVT